MDERKNNGKDEEKLYTPDFEHINLTLVNPSIDFNDRAYFGVWLPVKEEDNEKLCLVTSDRNIIVCQKQNLEKEKIKLSHFGIKFENRWSTNSIKDFVNSLNSVVPADLFQEIKETYQSFIDFPYLDFMSLWVMGTYLFPIFQTYPYIYIGGILQCGKTKILQVTSLMAFNSIFSNNMSTSAIFRLIQNGRCSLFIDESEKLVNPERSQDFRSILLSGYKSGAKVYRTEKNIRDRYIVEAFEVYSPKMLANISGLEDVLENRCIRFVMKRTMNKEIGESEVNEANTIWQEIRDRLYVFALENWEEIKQIYETLSNETILSNREWEIWKPMFALAVFIDRNLYDNIKNLAEMKTNEKHIENVTETGEYILVETLLNLVKEDRYYKVKEIKDRMTESFDEEQKWLSNKWVGNALRRLGIVEKRRVGTGIEFKISVETVKELAERLGIVNRPTPSSQHTPHSQESSELSEHSEVSV